MRNKKLIIFLILCIVIVAGAMIYRLQSSKNADPKESGVTVAQVARAVALLEHSVEECEAAPEHFENNENWYVPYMNEMYETGYFTEKQIQPTGKQATSAFTFGKLEQLYENMGITDKELLSYVKNNKSVKVVTNSLWSVILNLLAEKVAPGETGEEEFNIVATASNVSSLDAWTVVTTIGDYQFTGLAMDYYIDKRVKVLTKEDQILCVTELLSDSVLYPNSLATSIENGEIHAFINGVVRTFQIEDQDASSTNAVVDIRVKKGKVSDYQVKQNYVSGKLLKYTDSTVEIEGLGSFAIGEGFRVYKTYGNIESKTLYDMVVGYDVQKFVIEDDKVCAVLIDRNFVAQNIRVVIKTNGFSGIYHDSLLVSSEAEYQFSYGNETKKFSAGEEYTITPYSPYLSEGTLKISVSALDGRITLKSLQRGYGEPSYRGTIEVTKTEEGLLVINELPLEEYLYAVVPSEMPYTYSKEALKAQAVCARSYAYRQMLGNAYANLGAHVDDSTAFQVYNNSEEQVTTNQAVDETYGQVMLYDNEPISAFFYSTSCGYGTDADIWGGEGYPYIRGRLLSTDNASFDLTDETQFRMFITSTYDTYDKNYGWYRWNVTLPLSSITQSVNAQIASFYAASPEKVLTLEGSTYVSKEISTVGNVQSVETGTRGNGGVLHSIIIHGDQATVMIQTESYIRRILNPSGCILQKLDGTTTDTMTTLPSAFFVIDEVREGDTLAGYKFQGGGYGHGAGMSQNGANSMGDAGMGYEEILNFFYNDITIQQMY